MLRRRGTALVVAVRLLALFRVLRDQLGGHPIARDDDPDSIDALAHAPLPGPPAQVAIDVPVVQRTFWST